MITDEQLEELDTCNFDWGCYDRTEKYAYARRAIALALQVKPLEQPKDDYGIIEWPKGYAFDGPKLNVTVEVMPCITTELIAKIEAIEADVDLIEPPQYYAGFEECKALILEMLRGEK